MKNQYEDEISQIGLIWYNSMLADQPYVKMLNDLKQVKKIGISPSLRREFLETLENNLKMISSDFGSDIEQRKLHYLILICMTQGWMAAKEIEEYRAILSIGPVNSEQNDFYELLIENKNELPKPSESPGFFNSGQRAVHVAQVVNQAVYDNSRNLHCYTFETKDSQPMQKNANRARLVIPDCDVPDTLEDLIDEMKLRSKSDCFSYLSNLLNDGMNLGRRGNIYPCDTQRVQKWFQKPEHVIEVLSFLGDISCKGQSSKRGAMLNRLKMNPHIQSIFSQTIEAQDSKRARTEFVRTEDSTFEEPAFKRPRYSSLFDPLGNNQNDPLDIWEMSFEY